MKKTANGSTSGHVPKSLAATFARLMDAGYVTDITGSITGPPRSVAIGTWTVGGGIELPCHYVMHGPKMHKTKVRGTLKDILKKKHLTNN